MGVTPRLVLIVEGGQEVLTVKSLASLADALQVTVVDLFEEPQSRLVRPGRPPKET